MYKYFLDTLLCRFTSAVVMPSGYYGNAADDIPSYFSELHCSGFENSLSQCRYNRGELSCPDPQRDAAVSCSGVEAVVIPGSNKILFLFIEWETNFCEILNKVYPSNLLLFQC